MLAIDDAWFKGGVETLQGFAHLFNNDFPFIFLSFSDSLLNRAKQRWNERSRLRAHARVCTCVHAPVCVRA